MQTTKAKDSYKALIRKRVIQGSFILTKSSEMSSILFASLILVSQVLSGYTLGNVFTIKRNRHVNFNPKFISSWDSFNIPTSMCNRTSMGEQCGPFGAFIDGGHSCECFCPSNRSTFVFHDNKWTCLDNHKVRDLQGKNMQLFLLTESEGCFFQCCQALVHTRELHTCSHRDSLAHN